jgi:hypothetical protein
MDGQTEGKLIVPSSKAGGGLIFIQQNTHIKGYNRKPRNTKPPTTENLETQNLLQQKTSKLKTSYNRKPRNSKPPTTENLLQKKTSKLKTSYNTKPVQQKTSYNTKPVQQKTSYNRKPPTTKHMYPTMQNLPGILFHQHIYIHYSFDNSLHIPLSLAVKRNYLHYLYAI